jgi:uncharacterized protein YacL
LITEMCKTDQATKDAVSEDAPVSSRLQLKELWTDAQEIASAEIEYYKARLSYSKDVAKKTGLYIALAAFTFFGAIVALILGLLLTLSAFLNPIIATIVVTSFFVFCAIFFALLARGNSRKLSFSNPNKISLAHDHRSEKNNDER